MADPHDRDSTEAQPPVKKAKKATAKKAPAKKAPATTATAKKAPAKKAAAKKAPAKKAPAKKAVPAPSGGANPVRNAAASAKAAVQQAGNPVPAMPQNQGGHRIPVSLAFAAAGVVALVLSRLRRD